MLAEDETGLRGKEKFPETLLCLVVRVGFKKGVEWVFATGECFDMRDGAFLFVAITRSMRLAREIDTSTLDDNTDIEPMVCVTWGNPTPSPNLTHLIQHSD